MKKYFFLFLSISMLSACSVYKSTVRKQFESSSPERVTSTSLVTEKPSGDCETLGPARAWIQKEFPSNKAELLISENDLEVWKQIDSEGHILIQSFRLTTEGTESCQKTFRDEATWDRSSDSYLSLL